MRRLFERIDYAIWLMQERVSCKVRAWSDTLRDRADWLGYRLQLWSEQQRLRLAQSKWPGFIRSSLGLLREALSRVLGWIKTRELHYLMRSSPALLVAGCVTLVLLLQAARPRMKQIERYRAAARRSLAAERWSSADLWLRKLAQLGGSDRDLQLQRAFVASRLGNQRQAAGLLRELAPIDSEGHPEAHYLIATRVAWKAEDTDIRIHHLQVATQSRFADRAHALLGQVFGERGEYRRALRHLGVAVETDPELRFQMAHLYHLSGNVLAAGRQLVAAEEHYRKAVKLNRGNIEARLRWATACSMQGQFTKAERIVREGFGESRDPRLNAALADIYASMAAQLETAGPDAIDLRLGLLQQALSYAPNDALALSQVAGLLPAAGADPTVTAAVLHNALADGNGTSVIHLILSTYKQNRGNSNPALFHMEQAYHFSPIMPEVVNNLATTLANLDPPQRSPALDIVTSALQVQPEDRRIRNTRGQILADQGRWQEALPDLESALSEMAGNRELHETLSQAYEQLGDSDSAREHRQRARLAKTPEVQR